MLKTIYLGTLFSLFMVLGEQLRDRKALKVSKEGKQGVVFIKDVKLLQTF